MFNKRLFFGLINLALVFTAVTSKAEDSNIAKSATVAGKYEIAGTFSLNSSSSGMSYTLQPQFGYFFWDRTQFGFSGTLNNSDFRTTGVVGLSATHYFFTEKNLGSFISQSVLTTYGESRNIESAVTAFGVSFFVTPNVAYKTAAALSYPMKGVVTFSTNISGALAFYF